MVIDREGILGKERHFWNAARWECNSMRTKRNDGNEEDTSVERGGEWRGTLKIEGI